MEAIYQIQCWADVKQDQESIMKHDVNVRFVYIKSRKAPNHRGADDSTKRIDAEKYSNVRKLVK